MQKQILIIAASLALLAGCGGREDPGATSTAATAPGLETGEKAYKGTCSICHKTGLNGAPRVDSRQDWEARLAQGNEVLYERSIKGYRGSKGFMPPRGSNTKLSDSEVKAAVDFMVARAMQAKH